VFTVLLLGYTVYLLNCNPDFWSQFKSSFELILLNSKQPILYIVIFFLFINWLIEAYKWNLLVKPAISISIYQGIRSVLIGLGTGFFTPRSIGDYFGRLFSLPTEDKWVLTGAIILSRMAQMFATLLFGIISLTYIYQSQLIENWIFLFLISLLFVLMMIVAIWKRNLFLQLIQKHLPSFYKMFKIIDSYKLKLIVEVYVWSIIRHLIFTLQFIWILQLLDPSIQFWNVLPYVSMIYLSKAIVPSFNFLSDLGVREYSSIFFLGLYGVKPEIALSAGMFIWLINILFPSLVGGVLIWRK
jgi:uncharacterized membrane protein YbhN (UPF0104 family)